MSTAELNKKKLELIAWINGLSNENVIEFLHGLKSSESRDDWWDELSITQQQMINDGIKDIETGNVLSSSQFWNALKNG
jgi:predicted alpha-1,6-mannanase (GH76 family)